MNETITKIASQLENLIRIQRTSVIRRDPGVDYMHGMLNGLIMSHSVVTNSNPIFYKIKRVGKPRNRIRHKCVRSRDAKPK